MLTTAAVVDVDLSACLFDDRADLFAARADDNADLARLDLHGFDAGCIGGELLFGFGADFEHLVQDMQAPLFCLRKGCLHDLLVDPFDFDVELEGCDPVVHRRRF